MRNPLQLLILTCSSNFVVASPVVPVLPAAIQNGCDDDILRLCLTAASSNLMLFRDTGAMLFGQALLGCIVSCRARGWEFVPSGR